MYRTFWPKPLPADQKTIVFDVETSGLDWKRDKVVGYVITLGPNPEDTTYYPVRHEGGDNYNPDEVEAWIRSWAHREDLLIVGHNLKFDMHFSANYGIVFGGKTCCTMTTEALIDENQRGYSLDALTKKYGVAAKQGSELYEHMAELFGGEAARSQMANFWRLSGSDPLGVEYAEGDGVSTWALWEAQKVLIELQELTRIWELECRVTKTLFRVERRGVRVDESNLKMVRDRILSQAKEVMGSLPKADLNVRSLRDLVPMVQKLVEEGKAPPIPMTAPSATFPEGQPSLTEKYLNQFELGQQIVKVRKLTNLLNSFIDPLLNTHLFQGRVHCEFNQMKADDYGTRTGRLSCSNPNLQQVPKRDKVLAPIFRSVFVPDEGMLWSSNDYKQQEYVVFAEYSGNERLQEGYRQNPPIDAHQTVADMLGVERDPTAKRMNLGMIYGMGVAKLAASLDVDEQQARVWMAQYHANFPEAKKFLKRAKEKCEDRGYVITLGGRRCRIEDKRFAHKAGNRIIQGTCADITKLKMVEVDEYFHRNGDQAQLILQVHDELVWQFPDTEEGWAQNREAQRIMQDFSGYEGGYSLDTPLRVDSHEASNWSEASFPAKK